MAQDLELKVDSSKYEARIAMLDGYVIALEGLVDDYLAMKNRVSDFMDEEDDNTADMKQAVEERINRVRKAIAATRESIKTLQDTASNMQNLGQNVSTLLQKGIQEAAFGLLD